MIVNKMNKRGSAGDVWQEACNILTLGNRRKERITARVRGKSVQIGYKISFMCLVLIIYVSCAVRSVL